MIMNVDKFWIGILVGFAIVIAGMVAGSVYTSHQMDVTADTHGMSTGRPGDPKPNMVDDKPAPSEQRLPTTTGSGGAVPPG
jgi:hypothetical protein